VWDGADRRRLAESLAEMLGNFLSPDLIHVRLTASAGQGPVEVAWPATAPDDPATARRIADALAPWLGGAAADGGIVPLPHPSADAVVLAAVTPIGGGGEFGVLVAASARPGFPTEEDRLLLGVLANQAAAVLQRQRAEESVRLTERRFRTLA